MISKVQSMWRVKVIGDISWFGVRQIWARSNCHVTSPQYVLWYNWWSHTMHHHKNCLSIFYVAIAWKHLSVLDELINAFLEECALSALQSPATTVDVAAYYNDSKWAGGVKTFIVILKHIFAHCETWPHFSCIIL